MIGVEPGGRRWGMSSPAQFGRGGDVDKAAGWIASQEADAADGIRRVSLSVVVEVAGQRSRRFGRRSAAEHLAGHVGEEAAVGVSPDPCACPADVREIEIAVGIQIERRDTSRRGSAGAGCGLHSPWHP